MKKQLSNKQQKKIQQRACRINAYCSVVVIALACTALSVHFFYFGAAIDKPVWAIAIAYLIIGCVIPAIACAMLKTLYLEIKDAGVLPVADKQETNQHYYDKYYDKEVIEALAHVGGKEYIYGFDK